MVWSVRNGNGVYIKTKVWKIAEFINLKLMSPLGGYYKVRGSGTCFDEFFFSRG